MKVLVIRLGALGDFVFSFPAFAAIRAWHASDEVTLLTAAAYTALAAPWFDRVVADARPAIWDAPGLLRLRRQLRGFDRVYDLQTSSRSGWYFWLAGRPPWSGIVRGCSLPDLNPARTRLHTIERQRAQLAAAGVEAFPAPDLAWLRGGGPVLPTPYALLLPGSSDAHGGAKRWPVARFGELAVWLAQRGVTPVVGGSAAEAPLAAAILAACPAALDLTGRTDLAALAGVGSRATLAVGGDTGPVHLAASVGCRVVALFSAVSDPVRAAPRGPAPGLVTVLRGADLADLPFARVAEAVADGH